MARYPNQRKDTPLDTVSQAVPVIDEINTSVTDGDCFSIAANLTVATATSGALWFYVPDNDFATLTIDMTNPTSDLTYTAVTYGPDGNDITVTHVDPAGNDKLLAVTVVGTDISISLATGAGGAITSTAALVKAAVNVHAAASLLVACEDEGVGSGIVNADAETNLAGGANRVYMHLKTPTISCDTAISVSLLEDYTMTGTLATLSPLNRRRIGTPTASGIVLQGTALATAVGGSGALTLATKTIPAAADSVAIGPAINEGDKWVLAYGKNYLLAFANSSGGNSVVNYDIYWSEEVSG